MKREWIIGLASVAILGLGFGLMAYFSSLRVDPKKSPTEAPVRFVKAIPVKYEDSGTSLVAFGRVASAQSVSMAAEVAGRLTAGDVPLRAGQRFVAGQVLYRIDDEEARLNLQSLKSDFLNLLATILGEMRFEYAESFDAWEGYFAALDVKKPLPPLPDPKSAKEKTFLSNKKILSQYYTIKGMEYRLTRYRFVAPYSGSIAELKVHEGSIVNSGAAIGRIIRTDRMEAEIAIAASEVRWISVGSSVSLADQTGEAKWSGSVARIADWVDQATQSVIVYVEIAANSSFRKLMEGAYLQAEFSGRQIQKTMEIPRRALVKNNFVYVISDGKLQLEAVTIHKLNSETFHFSGLPEGLPVVIEPLANATENMPVRLSQP